MTKIKGVLRLNKESRGTPLVAEDSRSTKIICKIVGSKVGVPTYLVLYLNALISLLILATPWLFAPGAVPPAMAPWGETIWPSLLLVSTLVSLHGLLTRNPHVVALGAFGGFLLWFMDFIMYVLSGYYLADTLSLLFSVPMMMYYAYVYLRHSWLDIFMKANPNDTQSKETIGH